MHEDVGMMDDGGVSISRLFLLVFSRRDRSQEFGHLKGNPLDMTDV